MMEEAQRMKQGFQQDSAEVAKLVDRIASVSQATLAQRVAEQQGEQLARLQELAAQVLRGGGVPSPATGERASQDQHGDGKDSHADAKGKGHPGGGNE